MDGNEMFAHGWGELRQDKNCSSRDGLVVEEIVVPERDIASGVCLEDLGDNLGLAEVLCTFAIVESRDDRPQAQEFGNLGKNSPQNNI